LEGRVAWIEIGIDQKDVLGYLNQGCCHPSELSGLSFNLFLPFYVPQGSRLIDIIRNEDSGM
jgi:hypothetical protein